MRISLYSPQLALVHGYATLDLKIPFLCLITLPTEAIMIRVEAGSDH